MAVIVTHCVNNADFDSRSACCGKMKLFDVLTHYNVTCAYNVAITGSNYCKST